MKNKYIVPIIKVTFCSCEGYLLAGTIQGGDVVLTDKQDPLKKETGEVDMGAKHFSAWDTWDDLD